METQQVVAGRYVLGPSLGNGGMADVRRADDLETGEAVAFKVLRAGADRGVERFEIEARLLRSLDHPAIVRLRDAGTWEQRPFLVMDLIEGETLADRLRRSPLSTPEALLLAEDVADALDYAASRQVIHRDVKPANILLDRYGRAHLADFGIARLADATGMTSTGLVMGSAAYLAPEQVEGREVTPAADVYALGLVVIEAVTGQRPFGGTPQEIAFARLSTDPLIPVSVAPPVAALLSAMTRRDPQLRPTAATVRVELQRLRSDAMATAALDAVAGPAAVDRPDGAVATTAPVTTPEEQTRVLGPAADVPARAVAAAPARLPRRLTRPAALAAVAAVAFALVVFGLLALVGDDAPDRAPTPPSEQQLEKALDALEAAVRG